MCDLFQVYSKLTPSVPFRIQHDLGLNFDIVLNLECVFATSASYQLSIINEIAVILCLKQFLQNICWDSLQGHHYHNLFMNFPPPRPDGVDKEGYERWAQKRMAAMSRGSTSL